MLIYDQTTKRSMNSGYGFAQKEDDYPENRLNGKWYANVMGKK
jgi:hypothetical protein